MKIKYFWKPILWLVIICYALFVPASEIPSKSFLSIPHFDKFVHFTLFFVFCVLLFRPFKKLNLKHYLVTPVVAFLFGITLEILQQKVSITRSSDFYDFLANTCGIITAILFFHFFVQGKKWQILF